MDPAGDYNRLTREMVGRRVNLAIPEESTLVEKATGAVPHSGNQCYEPESQYNQAVLEWIRAGALYDGKDVAKVTGIEVYPKQIVLEGASNTQQITVRATYSDGTDRDVTKLALFMSNNDPTATINKDGLVTASLARWGERWLAWLRDEAWLAGDDPRQRFYDAISRDNRAWSLERDPERWHSADSLAMALALEPDGAGELVERPLAVETGHGLARGATVVDWERASGRPDNAAILKGYAQARLESLVRRGLGLRDAGSAG